MDSDQKFKKTTGAASVLRGARISIRVTYIQGRGEAVLFYFYMMWINAMLDAEYR